jgi:hypothetical protein
MQDGMDEQQMYQNEDGMGEDDDQMDGQAPDDQQDMYEQNEEAPAQDDEEGQ